MDSPEPNDALSGSDFDGMSDTTAATPMSSTTGDNPPSVVTEIKLEIDEESEYQPFNR